MIKEDIIIGGVKTNFTVSPLDVIGKREIELFVVEKTPNPFNKYQQSEFMLDLYDGKYSVPEVELE